MARVLLINSNRFKQPWPMIPFGLCSVAAAIEKAGHEPVVLDLCFSGNCSRDIHNTIEHFKPDVMGISVRNIDNGAGYHTLFLLDHVKNEVILPCKKFFSGPIVIGGSAVGISGAEMLSFFDLEYAVRGDGEAAMTELVKRLERKETLEGLDGLTIRKGGKIIQDPPPFFVEDLNSLHFSRPYKYLDIQPYRRFDSPLQIQTKRGCPLKCSYCTYNRIEGHHYRLRKPEFVAKEIEDLVSVTGIKHIEFTDSTFNIPLEHSKAVLRAISKSGLKLRLHTMGVNPGAVDEELIDLMKEVGFTDVDLGAESGSAVTLKNLAKNFTKEDILRAAKLLQDRKISIQWFLLVGAPAETRETLQETFDTISRAALKWDLIDISVGLRVYNGSPAAEWLRRKNPNCTNDNFLHPAHVEPSNINLNTIKRLTKHASFRYPNFFMHDEDENIPAVLTIIGVKLLRLFGLRKPVWIWFILLRRLETVFGIRRLKLFFFEFRFKGNNNPCGYEDIAE